jgi:hypothetical protein
VAEKPIVVFRFDRDPLICRLAVRLGAQHVLGLDSFYSFAMRASGIGRTEIWPSWSGTKISAGVGF